MLTNSIMLISIVYTVWNFQLGKVPLGERIVFHGTIFAVARQRPTTTNKQEVASLSIVMIVRLEGSSDHEIQPPLRGFLILPRSFFPSPFLGTSRRKLFVALSRGLKLWEVSEKPIIVLFFLKRPKNVVLGTRQLG